ncbi:MAG: hypothetical protein FI725_02205 [SAR202 cluster bacterium]|nr:hypothetical protein [SAR202 cluster bacterium]
MNRNPVKRRDALPEDATYRDTGCGDGCTQSLECPFPRCLHDEPRLSLTIKQTKRDREVRTVQQLEGLDIKELSLRFGVSSRTIHRILARTRLRPT